MIPDQLLTFWDQPRLATLGTVRADGSPHLVPVKSMRAGDEFWVLTRPQTIKVRNLVSRPRASLAEYTDSTWATVEGKAYVTDDDYALDRAKAAYLLRYGERDVWGSCVLIIEVDRVLHGS